MSAVLLAALALPALAALVCVVRAPSSDQGPGRLGAAAAGASFALAVAIGATVAVSGPVSAVVHAGNGGVVTGLFADRLSAVMLVLVFGVSAVVQLFTSRYLSADPRQARLVAAAGLTTTAVAGVACAATLSVLVGAWVLSAVGLLLMLAQRADLPEARVGLRRTALAFAIGDLALVAAACLAWLTVGEIDLRRVEDAAAALGAQPLSPLGVSAGAVVACLIVVTALARSALLPLHRWLPATLNAPTPVSAFLHAGLVNAGGFLLVRLGPIFGLTPVAAYAAFAAGAATALYGTALMLAKPDVKGALAHSTMGQMGFMVMACALGAYAAAIFHLVAHGLYKASLFLGADSAVHTVKRRAVVPRPAPAGMAWSRPVRLLVAGGTPAAALTLAVTTFAQPALHGAAGLLLLAFAWATAAHAGAAWLRATPGRAAAGMVALTLSCVLYAGAVAVAHGFLGPALGEARYTASGWAILAPAALAAVVLAARAYGGARRRRTLYAWALDAGHVASHSQPLGPPRRPPGHVPVPSLQRRERVPA